MKKLKPTQKPAGKKRLKLSHLFLVQSMITLCPLAVQTPVFAEELETRSDLSSLSLKAPKQPENIQVLLEKEAGEILLEVKGPYYIFNPQDGSKIAAGLLGKRFIVRAAGNGLKWGEEFPGIFQISVSPRSPDSSILVNGLEYQGNVLVYAVGSKINVVNELSIENYIKCLLTPQFPFPLENEVMSAVAILARTEAYYHIGHAGNCFWHVDAKEAGYVGSALNSPKGAVERIVDLTKNLILVHSENGISLPFPAKWSEHSAGKTAAFTAIFRKDAFFSNPSLPAAHAAIDREEAKWHFSLPKEKLAQKFQMQTVKNIEHFIDKESNKTYGVRLHSTTGSKDLSFFEFQEMLGIELLQSNDFKTEIKGESISFAGYGKGHGVGLCLYSASAMAQNGDNALKILSKFFPETYLYNLTAIPSSSAKE